MNEIRLTGSVELAAAAADGKVPTFTMLAYSGGPMKLAGFGVPVVVDAKGVSWPTMPAILRDHSPERIVGHADKIDANKKTGEILVEGVISGSGPDAAEVVASAAKGFPWQASIGATVERSEYIEAGAKATVNGRTITGPLQVVRAATLREISFVAIGADAATSAAIAAKSATGGKGSTMNSFDEWLSASGFDAAALTESQRTALQAAYDAQRPPAKGNEHGTPATRAEVDALYARYNGTGYNPDLDAARERALGLGLTARQTELDLLLASRGTGAPNFLPNGTGRSGPAMGEVLEASLLLQSGVSEKFVGEQFGERVADRAMSKDYRGLGLHALCRAALQSRGLSTGPGRLTESHLREALDLRASGLSSTVNVPGILSNAMGKQMLAQFAATPTTWSKFCRTSSVSDFKEANGYRLTSAGHIEEIPANGSVPHTSLTESEYSRQATQYGKLIGLDRKDIVNDDLGAFQAMPSALARMAALTLERAVYVKLLGNAGNFFHSSNGNNLTGGGSALGDTGLTTAYKTMLELEDTDGRPVLIEPKTLLVCPALWRTARSLTQSTGTNATTTANSPIPDGNPWAGMFEVVSSPYLGLSQGITNGSDTLWYLLAAPGDFAILDVHFLNGQQVPAVESFDMAPDRLGLIFRVVYDFGVAFLEPKGGIRNAGA